jgi:predicted metal-dependent HD superfamily phosphohydrolase
MSSLERWAQLWPLAPLAAVKATYERWLSCYSEFHRAYHTTTHIGDCLQVFDGVRHLAADPQSVEAILWWHDLVYDARGYTDNEGVSAEIAVYDMQSLGCSEEFQQRVADGIIATKHTQGVTDPDQQLVLDIDLHTLGTSLREYKQYAIAIRREYEHVPWATYAQKRIEILQSLLAREHIFYVPLLRERYERAARFNLRREIAFLQKNKALVMR